MIKLSFDLRVSCEIWQKNYLAFDYSYFGSGGGGDENKFERKLISEFFFNFCRY